MAILRLPKQIAARPCRELAGMLRSALQAWRAGRRPWLTAVMCLLCAGCTAAARFQALRPALSRAGDVYANLPLVSELARLPLSAFLPTADLPLWGAVLQTAVVVGLAELSVGRLATLLIAAAGQLLSTLAVRYLVALGTAVVIGLPLSQGGVLDTGPSGMSTAVGGWLLARRGAYVTLTLLVGAIAVAAVLQANLDGREHAVALLVGVGVGLTQAPATRVASIHVVRWLRALRGGASACAALMRQSSRRTARR